MDVIPSIILITVHACQVCRIKMYQFLFKGKFVHYDLNVNIGYRQFMRHFVSEESSYGLYHTADLRKVLINQIKQDYNGKLTIFEHIEGDYAYVRFQSKEDMAYFTLRAE